MKYSIHKDRAVLDTINHIKNILKCLQLNVAVKYFDYKESDACSCRIILSDIEEKNIGTNGKGTCKDNALASGYAEFMERLQTSLLLDFSGNFYQEADEILLDKEEVKNSVCYDDFKLNPKLGEYVELLNQLMYLKNNKSFDFSKEVFIPFISVKTKKKVYIPSVPLFIMLGSNGFSAGNTYKEALVQGLSEICERDILNDIYNGKIIFGNIPKKHYNQYSNINNLIKFIERHGYKVSIKDVSNEKNFPVIAALFEDKETGITEIKLGSSPFFPVAIERTLTEFLQGFSIEDAEKRDQHRKMFAYNGEYVDGIMQNGIKSCLFFQKNAQRLKNCFSDEKQFNKKCFLWNDETDNENAYKFLIDKILKVADDIFVRDYTIFGFPTVVIYIPKLSPQWEIYDDQVIDYTLHYLKWDLFFHNIDKLEDKSTKSLIVATKLRSLKSPRIDMQLSDIPSEIISLLCFIIEKDYDNIKKYLDITFMMIDDLASNTAKEKCIKFFTPIKKYFDLFFEGLSENEIYEKFENKKQYKHIKNMIDNFSFEQLLEMLKKHNSKKGDMSNIQSAIKNLEYIYKNNVPNQEKLREIL